MKIHLLSGFLGSGKTTAIANAAVHLMKEGKRVGVITNDQGKYQVDSKFINSRGVPTVEVSNGCFCCNYDSLDEHIISLDENQSPDYIFAESVGSCTDIIATVLKPLQAYRNNVFETISLSTFADARMLLHFLKNQRLPFSEEVNYIIQKQYEEADILVVNKIDLLDAETLQVLKNEVVTRYPDKRILYQNAHNEIEVRNWVSHANQTLNTQTRASLDIHYDKYGQGEAKLGWLDQHIVLEGENAMQATQDLSNLIYEEILRQNKSIGHLKFIISDGTHKWKLSYTSFDHSDLQHDPISAGTEQVELLINARVEASPEELERMVSACMSQLQSKYAIDMNTISQDAFAPGFPEPVHRLT